MICLLDSQQYTLLQGPNPDADLPKLHKHLFEHYNKAVRPVYDDFKALNLSVQFWCKQILKVEESDQILTIYCWLEMVSCRVAMLSCE